MISTIKTKIDGKDSGNKLNTHSSKDSSQRYLFFQKLGNFLKESMQKMWGLSYENCLELCVASRCHHIVEAIALSLDKNYDEIYNTLKQFYKFFLKKTNTTNLVFFEDEIDKSELLAQNYQLLEDYFFPENIINILYEKGKLTNNHVIYLRKYSSSIDDTSSSKQKAETEEIFSAGENLFKTIITFALREKASDIHIVPKSRYYYVFFRLHGQFINMRNLLMSKETGDAFITYLMRRAAQETKGRFNADTRLEYQDARFRAEEFGIDLRIAIIPEGVFLDGRVEVVIRILKKIKVGGETSLEKALLKLNYLPEDIDILTSMIHKPNGIIVISGVTNSGKSTLVTTLLSYIQDRKVGSIEDPVEYFVDNINYIQHQIYTAEKIQMDFQQFVKAFKRADYDVIFIGEWRNHPGLTEAIIEQAYAGQLIFTTLHISHSFQIFESLKNMYFVEPDKLKTILCLSWNQILVSKLCENCKQKIKDKKIKNDVLKSIEYSPYINDTETLQKIENLDFDELYTANPKGCSKCINGYQGRQVIYDYFIPTKELFEEIARGNYFAHFIENYEKIRFKKKKIDVFFSFLKQGVVGIETLKKIF